MVDAKLLTGLGAASAVFLSALGTAIASINAGTYAVRSRQSLLFSLIPIIISGVLAIYGLIIAVMLSARLQENDLTVTTGYQLLSAGLAVGLACLASGFGMAGFLKNNMGTGVASPAERAEINLNERPLIPRNQNVTGPTPITVKFCMVMAFVEAVGLYGLIVALLIVGNS